MDQKKLVSASIIFMGIVLLVFLLREFQNFVRPFVIACILTLLFQPTKKLSQRTKWKRRITTIVVVALVALIGFVFAALIAGDNTDLNENLPEDEELISEWVVNSVADKTLHFFGRSIHFTELVSPEQLTTTTAQAVGYFLGSIGTFMGELLLIIIFLLFLLPSHHLFIERVKSELKPKRRDKFLNSLHQIEDNIRTYLSTKALISLGTAVVTGIFLVIFNSEYVVFFMALVFAMNFIPNIGSIAITAIILITYLLSNGFSGTFVGFAIAIIFTQLLFGNYLDPKISGRNLRLSPIVVILSLLFWGAVWGVAGMLIAVPLTSIIKIILADIDSTKTFAKFLA